MAVNTKLLITTSAHLQRPLWSRRLPEHGDLDVGSVLALGVLGRHRVLAGVTAFGAEQRELGVVVDVGDGQLTARLHILWPASKQR